jgi:imidazolonepropionase-like amidohydrolase
VPVAFGSGSALEMRMTAALAIGEGMPPEIALRGLTSVAADLAGLPKGTGRLVAGAPADFVIWTGSPLDLRARALRVVVDGQAVPNDS